MSSDDTRAPAHSKPHPPPEHGATASRQQPCHDAGHSDERTLWYVETLFAYINQLMERTQTRCNYMIFSDSVASVALFTVISAVLSSRGPKAHLVSRSTVIALALLPAALLLASLAVAVSAFLPRIYDPDIELNHEFIARMTAADYHGFIHAKSAASKLDDYIAEIHVLSRILNDRTARVNLSARLFITALVLIPAAIACAFV